MEQPASISENNLTIHAVRTNNFIFSDYFIKSGFYRLCNSQYNSLYNFSLELTRVNHQLIFDHLRIHAYSLLSFRSTLAAIEKIPVLYWSI